MARADRRLVAAIGAGVVVIVTTLIIVFAAIVPVPDFAQLQAGQQSGYVAYVVGDNDGPTSVRIVDLESIDAVTAGEGREVELVGWHDDGNLVIIDWGLGGESVLVDPVTGDEIRILEPDDFDRDFADQAFVDHEDGTIVLEQTDGVGSASFTAPESYDIRSAVTMGDDRMVFVDELGRVAVTYLGEGVEPLLVASDAAEWSSVAARP